MKISGAEQVNIMGMTQLELRLKEDQAIQSTTNQLAQEGKTVINIIHGTPMFGVGSTHKTLTFLWEGDDTHPKYLELQRRKQAVADGNRRMAERKEKKERCIQEIKELEERIQTAENAAAETIDKKAVSREIKKVGAKRAGIGLLIAIGGGVLWISLAEKLGWDGLTICGIIFTSLVGLLMLWLGCTDIGVSPESDEVKKEIKKRTEKNKDKENLDQLKQQLEQKRKELQWGTF